MTRQWKESAWVKTRGDGAGEGGMLRRPINGLPGSGPTIAGRGLVTVSRNKME